MRTVREIVLRSSGTICLYDDMREGEILKYRLFYRNEMRVVADGTALALANDVFRFQETFAEDNRALLERAGACLQELSEDEQEEGEWIGAWGESSFSALEKKEEGLFLVLDDGAVYWLERCDFSAFKRLYEEYGPIGEVGEICVSLAHRHGVRLEAFEEVPNGYCLLYGIRFDDWTPYRECYYFYDGYDIGMDDFDVVIPYGRENALRLGYVSSKRYFREDALPLPLKKIKYILGRAEDLAAYSAKQLHFLKDKRVCVHLRTGESLEGKCLISPKKHCGEWNFSVPMQFGGQVVHIGSYEIGYIEYFDGEAWLPVVKDAQRQAAARERRLVCKDMMRFWRKKVHVLCKNGEEYIGKYIWYDSFFKNDPYPESIELLVDGYRKEKIFVQDIKEIDFADGAEESEEDELF